MSRAAGCLLALLLVFGERPAHGVAPPSPRRIDQHGDPLPDGAVARLGTQRWRGGLDTAEAGLHFSADGKLLAGHARGRVGLWEVATGRPLTWMAHVPHVHAARFTADGKALWTARRDPWSGVTSWLVESWQVGEGRLIEGGRLPYREVLAASPVFSSDGSKIIMRHAGTVAVASASGSGRAVVARWPWVQTEAAALSPDARVLAVLAWGGRLGLFAAGTGKLLHDVRDWGKEFTSLTFSPDGKTLAAWGPRDNCLWEVKTGKVRHRLAGLGGPAAFRGDGKVLACAARKAIHLVDPATGKVLSIFPAHGERSVAGLAFSPDGKRLALAGQTISLWDVRTGQRDRPLPGHGAAIVALAFSADGRRLATGGRDGLACVWDGRTGRLEHTLTGHDGAASGLAFSADGALLATGEGVRGQRRETSLRLWDLRKGRLSHSWKAHQGAILQLLFSPDGRLLASAPSTGGARLWEVKTGYEEGEVHGPVLRPVAFETGRRGLHLVSGDGQWAHWPATTRLTKLSRQVQGEALMAATLAGRVRVAAFPGEVCFHDGVSGKVLRRVPLSRLERDGVAALSLDGFTLALAGSEEGIIELWDVDGPTPLGSLRGHTTRISALALAPGGGRLASAAEDGTALLWDLDRLRLEFAGRQLFGRVPQGLSPERIAARLEQLVRVESEVGQHIARLDDDDYGVREKAQQALAQMADDAGPALRDALRRRPSLEAQRRIRRLLLRVRSEREYRPPELARVRVAVRQLGFVSVPGARRLLEEMARGDRRSTLTEEARKALARLGQRGEDRTRRASKP